MDLVSILAVSYVSIHAPAQGATMASNLMGKIDKFQSTPPRRGRPMLCSRRPQGGSVSIHAPAQGATPMWGYVFLGLFTFQSTPPRRGRQEEQEESNERIHRFNPRPRAGGDELSHRFLWFLLSFNPRPRAGGDLMIVHYFTWTASFNPRPRAGGDGAGSR